LNVSMPKKKSFVDEVLEHLFFGFAFLVGMISAVFFFVGTVGYRGYGCLIEKFELAKSDPVDPTNLQQALKGWLFILSVPLVLLAGFVHLLGSCGYVGYRRVAPALALEDYGIPEVTWISPVQSLKGIFFIVVILPCTLIMIIITGPVLLAYSVFQNMVYDIPCNKTVGMTLFSLGKAKLSKVRPVEETTTNPGSSGSMGSWMDAAEMDSWSVKLVSDTRELRAIRNLLSTSDAKLLGVGRDVRVAGKHTTLDLVHVWRITKPLKRMVYDGQKAQVMNRILRVEDETKPIVTKFDQVADSLPLHYDSAVNEKILLHGTKAEIVLSIMANGLNEKFCGGLFGRGVYLSEDAAKIDQYVVPDPGPKTDNSAITGLHEALYGAGKKLAHPGQVCYCFGVRVLLGLPLYTKDGKFNSHIPGESIWAVEEQELAAIPGTVPPIHYTSLIAEAGPGCKLQRHREFVVFHSDCTILEYLIAYRRV